MIIFWVLSVAIGAVLAGVFALERNHHGKGKAIHLAGKNIVKNVSFVLPPGETTPNTNPVPIRQDGKGLPVIVVLPSRGSLVFPIVGHSE